VAGNACDTDYVNLRARNILHHLSQIRAKFRYYREGIEEIINLQPLKDGKAKAYQVVTFQVNSPTPFQVNSPTFAGGEFTQGMASCL
jgi:hypothetical protein